MTAYAFGTGTLVAKRTDVTGQPPFLFGVLQDLTLDFDNKLETLLGQQKVAAYIGDAELKITGKAKYARLQMTNIANLLLGSSIGSGEVELTNPGETQTVSASTYSVTVNNATLTPLDDAGVIYAATGIALVPTPTNNPSTGCYNFNASTGVYTFNIADAGKVVLCYYSYQTATTSGGFNTVYGNPLMGTSPIFEVYFKSSIPIYGVNKEVVIKLNACKSSKLTLGFNNQKWVIPEFDFQAMMDVTGNTFTISTTE